MNYYSIIIAFLIIISLSIPVYADSKDIEVDWIIEGQEPIVKSAPHTIDIEEKFQNTSIIDEQINNFLNPENNLPQDLAVDFITGSGYMIGDYEITIESREGQILNELLLEQRNTNKENFFHMIKYLDRYSDGYVELAEALIDPVIEQQYLQGGVNRNHNINSNLEHFLTERGYSLENLESIPNNAFSPTKYDKVRSTAAQLQNEGVDSVDLRELLPNYVKPDSKTMSDEMIRSLSEQTANVYNTISSSELKINVEQNPDLANTISENLFDDFQFVNTQFENTKFENTQHVVNYLEKPQNVFKSDETYDYSLLFLIPIFIGFILIFYMFNRKSKISHPLPFVTISSSVNYLDYTNEMIKSSRSLFENNSPKYAFEKFSQALRYYYAHKLQINLDLTTSEILIELEKSKIENIDNVRKWLLLCGQVEFIKYRSTQKEFLNALDSFSKTIS